MCCVGIGGGIWGGRGGEQGGGIWGEEEEDEDEEENEEEKRDLKTKAGFQTAVRQSKYLPLIAGGTRELEKNTIVLMKAERKRKADFKRQIIYFFKRAWQPRWDN